MKSDLRNEINNEGNIKRNNQIKNNVKNAEKSYLGNGGELPFMGVLGWYVKGHLKTIILYCIFLVIFALVFSLYSLELEAILYGLLLCACVGVVFLIVDFVRFYRKHRELWFFRKQIATVLGEMPSPSNLHEADYQEILRELYEHNHKLISDLDSKQREMIDYYTLWAHQIKTPIAGMRLLLQTEQEADNRELLLQLFRIEQYVEMVLGYLRIENSSSDLVLENYDLSHIVRQAVRKYASVFIRKKITLDIEEFDCTVLTDEKWLVFVLEQVLSNALKYTNEGKISIYMDKESEKTLVIEDTGIGIAEEDLPRIFEKGFTGYNGRMDKKATGIGLYLTKKIINKLCHKIVITSEVGVGTKVMLDLATVKTLIE